MHAVQGTQEPWTKLWLFQTLVTPTLLYGIESRNLERPSVSMIACMIRSKSLVPHDIIRAEMGAAPIITEALVRSMTAIQRLWKLLKGRYSRLALTSSKQFAENGDNHCWYAETQQWLDSHGISIKSLSPFQYNLDCPILNMMKAEKKRVIWAHIMKLDNGRTWINPTTSLDSKMAHKNTNSLYTSEDGFILGPPYMDIHLPHAQ